MTRLNTALLMALSMLGVMPLATPAAAAGEEIVADVSNRRIEITSEFVGATTTLFGALPEQGDVLLVVTGPVASEIAVRRKESVFGFWVNRSEVTFRNVPGFYWYASSKPLAEIASTKWLNRNRIGADRLRFTIGSSTRPEDTALFQRYLVSLLAQDRLYAQTPAQAEVLGGRLYRADLDLPDTAPIGDYTVTTYLLQRGTLVGQDTITLTLRKGGAMAGLSILAASSPVVYALMAILLAVFFGWISAFLMHRR